MRPHTCITNVPQSHFGERGENSTVFCRIPCGDLHLPIIDRHKMHEKRLYISISFTLSQQCSPEQNHQF